jgi:hypothetical protein
VLRFSFFNSGAVTRKKNPVWRYPSGRFPPGKEVGGMEAAIRGVRPSTFWKEDGESLARRGSHEFRVCQLKGSPAQPAVTSPAAWLGRAA